MVADSPLPRHPIVELARRAVEAFVTEDRVIDPAPLPPDLPGRAGVFVTLRRRGELRGCVGTVEPATGGLAEEVIRSALLAATDDPRFPPVQAEELAQLAYEVSVLAPPEPVAGLAELDPARFGVIVSSGRRRGLLLPGVPGVDSARAQVEVARRKASIAADEPVALERFETRSFG